MSNSLSFVRLMKGRGLARPKLDSSVSRGLAALVYTREVFVHTESCSTKFPNFGFPGKSYSKSLIGTVIYTPPLSLFHFKRVSSGKVVLPKFFWFWSNMSCYTVISTSFLAVHPEKTAAISRRHYWFPREMTSEQRVQKFHTDGWRHRRPSGLLRRET